MSKIYNHYRDDIFHESMPSMDELEHEIEIAKKLKKAEDLLKKIEINSNPAYLKGLVDKYFKEEEEEK